MNHLSDLLHTTNIEKAVKLLEKACKEFKEKAPHRKDYIEAMEASIHELMEVELDYLKKQKEIKALAEKEQIVRMEKYRLMSDIELLKRGVEYWHNMYDELLKEDKL